MSMNYSKAPRIYIPDDIAIDDTVMLSRDHTHYLVNVMRKNDGDIIRFFNARDGEFIGKLSIQTKKSACLKWIESIADQPSPSRKIHLYIGPIKKDRMAFTIEKAVELGVTDIHPIQTDFTQNAKINSEKIQKQIIEAAEQCERMDIPTLHNIEKIRQVNFVNPSYCAIERHDDLSVFQTNDADDIGLIIGPEGGWSNEERDYLSSHSQIKPVSLGRNILRAETAAIFMLSRILT